METGPIQWQGEEKAYLEHEIRHPRLEEKWNEIHENEIEWEDEETSQNEGRNDEEKGYYNLMLTSRILQSYSSSPSSSFVGNFMMIRRWYCTHFDHEDRTRNSVESKEMRVAVAVEKERENETGIRFLFPRLVSSIKRNIHQHVSRETWYFAIATSSRSRKRRKNKKYRHEPVTHEKEKKFHGNNHDYGQRMWISDGIWDEFVGGFEEFQTKKRKENEEIWRAWK